MQRRRSPRMLPTTPSPPPLAASAAYGGGKSVANHGRHCSESVSLVETGLCLQRRCESIGDKATEHAKFTDYDYHHHTPHYSLPCYRFRGALCPGDEGKWGLRARCPGNDGEGSRGKGEHEEGTRDTDSKRGRNNAHTTHNTPQHTTHNTHTRTH